MQDLGYELPRITILRASVNRPWIAARLRRSASGEECSVEEEHVQTNDERDYDRGYRSGYAMVDQGTHHVVVAAEDQQWDEREGDAKGEHHLAYHQRATGVDPYGEDGQREEHGRVVARHHLELLEGLVDVADTGQAVGVEECCSHDEHAGVDGPGDD